MSKEYFYTIKQQDDPVGPSTALEISEAFRSGTIDAGDRVYISEEWVKLPDVIEALVVESASPSSSAEDESENHRFIYHLDGQNYGPIGWNTYRSLFKNGKVTKETPLFFLEPQYKSWLLPSDQAWDEYIDQPIEAETSPLETEPLPKAVQAPPQEGFQVGKWAIIVFLGLMFLGFITERMGSEATNQTQTATAPVTSEPDQATSPRAQSFENGIYYQSAGKAEGPVSAFGFLALMKEGKVGVRTLIASPGDEEWSSLLSQTFGFIRQLLVETSENGLQGEHHFRITFDPAFQGVIAPEGFADSSNNMTIVLDNWFKNLRVTESGFYVVLNFNNKAEQLYIPFGSLEVFSDPYSGYEITFE